LVVGIVSTAATFLLPLIARLFGANPETADWILIVTPLAALLICLVVVPFRGAAAKAQSLRAEIGRLREAEQNRVAAVVTDERKAQSHGRMNKLLQELDNLMLASEESRPSSGTNVTPPIMERDHASKMKESLMDWSKRAREEASTVSLANYLAPMSDVENLRLDYFELERFAARQLEAARTMLGELA
jgi:hypothetical protein